jgi:hypothetical protein
MSPISAATAVDSSLINGVEFLDELERCEPVDPRASDPRLDARTDADPFNQLDALDCGLPMDPAARPTDAPRRERALLDEPYKPFLGTPRSVEPHIPFMAAALVLVVGLTLGAVTAALVFHDQLGQITALRTATR